MKNAIPTVLFLSCLLGTACRSAQGWSNADALRADSIEMQLDADGRIMELEYHVSPDEVPGKIRRAMDGLHPGGRMVAAEKEYVDGMLFWEISKEIDGREVEAMFLPSGELHSEEIEVPETGIPASVRDAVRARRAGTVTKWEEIRDGERSLVEYHAKVTADGAKYKVVVSTDATVLRVVREVPAELEIPLP